MAGIPEHPDRGSLGGMAGIPEHPDRGSLGGMAGIPEHLTVGAWEVWPVFLSTR